MSEVVLKIENVSKQYRLGLVGTGTLSHDLKRWFYKVRGKEDPFLKVGEVNEREIKGGEYVNALSDINLEIKKGEVVGIIGKNGAGKSTLLKLLSEVTTPTTGSIKMKGRIAALLEVGTGFHPELTGRENIYLNGAILGMTKKEINSKIEEIIDFSGVAKYVDTPVKRYSSGMKVRLGFAVAAHLEPEILIVDEVLAVGDAEFQKKCIGKMKDVAGEGRTVLFVSHNMVSIKNLCTRGVFLKAGKVEFIGGIQDTIDNYMKSDAIEGVKGFIPETYKRPNTGEIKIKEVFLLDKENNNIDEIFFQSQIKVKLKLACFKKVENVILDIKIASMEGIVITHSINTWEEENAYDIEVGEHYFLATLENKLQPSNYSLTIGVHYLTGLTIDYLENIYDFSVLKMAEFGNEDYQAKWVHGWIGLDSKWERIA
jgi:lipopolysaccharide transport system ATP-binding protein